MLGHILKLEISGLLSGLYLGHEEKGDSEAIGLSNRVSIGAIYSDEKTEGGTGDWEVADKHLEFPIRHLNFEMHIRYTSENIKE